MTERDETKPTTKSLGDRARDLADRAREKVEDFLEALEELLTPAPTPRPIPVRNGFPIRR